MKSYWQIKEMSADQRSLQSAGWRSICWLKNYLQIEVKFLDRRNIWSADWRTICRLQKFLQIEEPFADWQIVCRPNDYSIGWLENDLQIKEVFNLQVEWIFEIGELSADRSLICRLKNYLQIIELSTNQGSIWSASPRSFYESKNYHSW